MIKRYKRFFKENEIGIGYSWEAWDKINNRLYTKKIVDINKNGDYIVISDLDTSYNIKEIEQKEYIDLIIKSDESDVKSGLKYIIDQEKEEKKMGNFYKNYPIAKLDTIKSELRNKISISGIGIHNDEIRDIVEKLIQTGWKFDLDSYDKKRRLIKNGKEIKQNILGHYGMDYAQFLSTGEIRKVGFARK